jgi:hypothetical protein
LLTLPTIDLGLVEPPGASAERPKALEAMVDQAGNVVVRPADEAETRREG